MSKKKKKEASIWDLTPEEQISGLRKIDEDLENNRVDSILSMMNVPPAMSENGLSMELEARISRDINKKYTDKTNEANTVAGYSQIHTVSSEQESYTPVQPDPIEQIREPLIQISNTVAPVYLREISFNILKDLNRLIINDGIAPTSVSLDIAIQEELDESIAIDSDMVADTMTEVINYIKSLKHPTAIYYTDDFHNTDFWKFGRVSKNSYNDDRYFFMEHDKYVFAYIIDTESVNSLIEMLDSYDNNDILSIILGMAYAAGTLNQAFFIEDERYIETFMHSRYNKQKEFHKEFVDDLTTVFIDINAEPDEDDGVDLYPAEALQTNTREIIQLLNGSAYDDDDDEEDNVNISITDSTDKKYSDDEDNDIIYIPNAEIIEMTDIVSENTPPSSMVTETEVSVKKEDVTIKLFEKDEPLIIPKIKRD